MPTRRKKRPRDPNQLGKMIVDISVGEVLDDEPERTERSAAARMGGVKGGAARARSLSPAERKRIAVKAAKARWKANAAARKREET